MLYNRNRNQLSVSKNNRIKKERLTVGHSLPQRGKLVSFFLNSNFCLFICFWLVLFIHFGLRCCAGFLLQLSEGLPFNEARLHCGGFSCCRVWALDTWPSVVVVQGLSCSSARDLPAPRIEPVSSYIGRQILTRCTTKEV